MTTDAEIMAAIGRLMRATRNPDIILLCEELKARIIAERTVRPPRFDLAKQVETLGADSMLPPETAKAMGRRGGLKGGKARAAKLTPERRREIARGAARGRWQPLSKPADEEGSD